MRRNKIDDSPLSFSPPDRSFIAKRQGCIDEPLRQWIRKPFEQNLGIQKGLFFSWPMDFIESVPSVPECWSVHSQSFFLNGSKNGPYSNAKAKSRLRNRKADSKQSVKKIVKFKEKSLKFIP